MYEVIPGKSLMRISEILRLRFVIIELLTIDLDRAFKFSRGGYLREDIRVLTRELREGVRGGEYSRAAIFWGEELVYCPHILV